MNEIEKVIKKYLLARNELISMGLKFPEYISGNDNMIGRIGEYLAILFLRDELHQNLIKVDISNQKGYDLIDLNNPNLTTQVKIITNENKKGRTVRLEHPWKQFILIDLDLNNMHSKIGFLTDDKFVAITKKKNLSMTPVVNRSMLGKRGRFILGGGHVIEKKWF